MEEKYEWLWCFHCHQRIFKDEKEGDTIKTIDGTLYCIDCANDLEECECGSGELTDGDCCSSCYDMREGEDDEHMDG